MKIDRRKIGILTFILLLLLAGPALPADPAPGEVVGPIADISERDYYPAVLREITNARESVVVAMYVFRVYEDPHPDSHTLKILQALVAAAKRGVRVKVVLGCPSDDFTTSTSRNSGGSNEAAWKMLSKAHADVRYAKETNTMHGKNGTFRMARGGLKRPRKGTGVDVPVGYWDYGWCRTLSMKAKVAYLLALAEQKTSSLAPWWSLNLLEISKRYTNAKSRSSMSEAMLELEEKDIVVISRHAAEDAKDLSERPPNLYCLKDLMSAEQIAKAWEEMEKEHGREKVGDARRLAAMLDRPNSRETTAAFVYCIDTWGLKATEAETKDVAEFARQNPYRHVGTVIYRLKKKYGEKK